MGVIKRLVKPQNARKVSGLLSESRYQLALDLCGFHIEAVGYSEELGQAAASSFPASFSSEPRPTVYIPK